MEVPIREAAEAAAVRTFQLSAEQRSRLVMKTLCDLKHPNLYAIGRPPPDALCAFMFGPACAPVPALASVTVRRCFCNGPAAGLRQYGFRRRSANFGQK